MTAPRRRKLIGRMTAFGVRQKVFLLAEGLEIDEADHGEVVRKRVFFDDVLAVTRHSILGWPFLAGMGCMTLFMLLPAFGAIMDRNMLPVAVVFVGLALVFLVLLVLRIVLRLDVVTVYGKRGKAEMGFWFRKARAAEVFQDLCERVRVAQEQASAARPAAVPPQVPPAMTAPPEAAPPA